MSFLFFPPKGLEKEEQESKMHFKPRQTDSDALGRLPTCTNYSCKREVWTPLMELMH